MLNLVHQKAEGQEITLTQPQPQRGQVIDLMAALKGSLDRQAQREKKPAVRAKEVETEKPRKRASSSKK